MFSDINLVNPRLWLACDPQMLNWWHPELHGERRTIKNRGVPISFSRLSWEHWEKKVRGFSAGQRTHQNRLLTIDWRRIWNMMLVKPSPLRKEEVPSNPGIRIWVSEGEKRGKGWPEMFWLPSSPQDGTLTRGVTGQEGASWIKPHPR